MILDQLGSLLHSRSSQGEVLSAVELEQLAAWYAEKDAQEAQLLKMPGVDVDCAALQAQIDAALEKISTVSQGIRQVSAENAVLRQEISELQQALIVPQSA
jgi:septal ring factor EnvC (AmiA/AmiB activator)